MNLNEEIHHKLISKGASIVGFADLKNVSYQIRNDLRYGIVIGIKLNPKVIKKINPGPSLDYYNEYDHVNERLNEIGDYTELLLKSKGYDAFSKSQKNIFIDQNTKRTDLPHKTVATRAGLGWIGKCALLITEQFGAAIRLTTVLTNAEIKVGRPINSSKCGECEECKKICPAEAVRGYNWDINLERDTFFEALKCRDKIIERGEKLKLREAMCGLCIYICPWTQKYLKNIED